MGDDMELVEGDARVGQMLGHSLDECWRHVDADGGDLVERALMRDYVFREGGQGLGVFAFGNGHYLAFAHISGDSQVVVAMPTRGLVDRTALTADRSASARAIST